MSRLRNIIFLLLSGIIYSACRQSLHDRPFPIDETEFSQPDTIRYTLGKEEKIKWETPKPDNTRQLRNKKIDFGKLPSKTVFDMGDYRPMPKTMVETTFDLDKLPDTLLDQNKIPSKKFTFKISALGQPIRTKALRPRLRDEANQSLYEYGLDQGLASGGGISAMFQDSRGLLWIATLNGLYRFDGENFDLYNAAQGLVAFNTIVGISEDRQGQIWVGSDQGIDVLNLQEGRLNHLGTGEGLGGNDINTFMVDKTGEIWVSTGTEIDIIDPVNNSIKNLSGSRSLNGKEFSNMLEDDNGNIWMGSVGSIYIIDKGRNHVKRFTDAGDFNNKIYKDHKGRILIRNSARSVDVIDLKRGRLKKIGTEQGISSDRVIAMASDLQGQLWISSSAGIDIILLDSNQIRHFNTGAGLGNIGSFLEDSQGHMWMTDSYSQINFMNLYGRKFKRNNRGLSTGAVRTVYEDSRNRLWIANSTDTTYIADPKTGTLKYIDSSRGLQQIASRILEVEKDLICVDSYFGDACLVNLNAGTIHYLAVPGRINKGITSGFLEDKMGKLWLWGEGGISVYDPRNNTFRNLLHIGPPDNRLVKYCIEDQQGNIWIATNKGIDILDPITDGIRHLVFEKQNALNNQLIFSKGENGKILMAAYGYGLLVFEPVNKYFLHFTTQQGLASDQTTSSIEKNGNLYAGTSEGLTILTPQHTGWKTQSYGRPQLFDNVDFNPTGIVTNSNRFWWGVGADGLLEMQEEGNDTIIPPMYISGMDIMEQPQNFLSSDSILSHTKINWDSVTGPFNLPINLTLPYNQNYIRFHFTGTHFDNTDKTRYRYILEGRDEHWSQITDQSFASYISLPPGSYQFKVACRGFNGLWSEPVAMSFTITPPWWKTWWAYLLFALVAGIIIWGAVTVYQTGRVKAENQRLEENVIQRTKELKLSLEELKETQALLIQQEKMASLGELTAGIAHEIQNPLNFVNNFSDLNAELIDDMEKEMAKGNYEDALSIAKDVKENEEKINHHGKRADAIVKGMLQHSRVTSGGKELTDINALADEYFQLAYHGLRAKDKTFNATLETHFDETIGRVNIVAQDIGRVLLNLFNNAFYATAERKKQQPAGYAPVVSVSTKNMDGKILISVKDNGNGIPRKVLDKIFQPFFTTKPTGQGTGLGLSLSYDIIKAHGGEIKVDTKENEGSEFLIQIPKT